MAAEAADTANDEGRFTTQFRDGNGEGRRMTDGRTKKLALYLSLCLSHDIDTEMRHRTGGIEEMGR